MPALGADGGSSLTHEYNMSSMLGHTVMHVVVMGAMMGIIGLASPVFLDIPAVDPFGMDFTGDTGRTPGDVLVQTAYGSGAMLGMFVDMLGGLVSIGEGLVANVFEGNFAPTTWDSMIASHHGGHMEPLMHMHDAM